MIRESIDVSRAKSLLYMHECNRDKFIKERSDLDERIKYEDECITHYQKQLRRPV